jgi:uncharacterized protein
MELTHSRLGAILVTIVFGLMALIAGLGALLGFLRPGPEGKIILATGGSEGAFNELAEIYKKDLARYGVTLELRPGVEGSETQKALLPQYKSEFKTFDEKDADIEAGFVKGGFASSRQGRFASDKQQLWHQRQMDGLRSVGRLFYEPLWVFTRVEGEVNSLRELKGKKIIIGARESGTRSIARHLLQANGIDANNATLLDTAMTSDGRPLVTHEADAVMMFLPAEAPKIQALLRNPQLRLMDFSTEAEAYAIRFPALTRVVLRQGSVEFNPDNPAHDVTLLATSVALVVRSSLNPSL